MRDKLLIDTNGLGDPILQVGGLKIWICSEIATPPCKVFGRKVELACHCQASSSLSALRTTIGSKYIFHEIAGFRGSCKELVKGSTDQAVVHLHDPENLIMPGVAIRLVLLGSLEHFSARVSMDPDADWSGPVTGSDRTSEHKTEFELDLTSIEKVIQCCRSFVKTLSNLEKKHQPSVPDSCPIMSHR